MHILSLEDRMPGDIDLYEQIASRATVDPRLSLIADAYALAIVDPCRDGHLDPFPAGCIPGAGTFRAFFFDDLA